MKTIKGQAFTQLNDLAWEEVGPGLRRKVAAYDDHLMAVHVAFEKDAVGQPHQHPHVQISYVATGSFKVHIDGEEKILRQGDYFYVAPNRMHGVVALEAGVLVDIFTPKREDFVAD